MVLSAQENNHYFQTKHACDLQSLKPHPHVGVVMGVARSNPLYMKILHPALLVLHVSMVSELALRPHHWLCCLSGTESMSFGLLGTEETSSQTTIYCSTENFLSWLSKAVGNGISGCLSWKHLKPYNEFQVACHRNSTSYIHMHTVVPEQCNSALCSVL